MCVIIVDVSSGNSVSSCHKSLPPSNFARAIAPVPKLQKSLWVSAYNFALIGKDFCSFGTYFMFLFFVVVFFFGLRIFALGLPLSQAKSVPVVLFCNEACFIC